MISVVIPVYKKTDDFIATLEHNLPYLQGCEIIVVNDDPTKSIKSALQKYPITLIENPTNLGFAGAVNVGIKAAEHKCVFLLNSDVLLLDTSYRRAEKTLKDDELLFAVAFAQKEKDEKIVGKNVVYWHQGLLAHRAADDGEVGKNGWAEGGSSLFKKEVLMKIGGFDPIFKPFYWEDVELSYRAKKHGYTVLFDPSIIVLHNHESTIGTFWSRRSIAVIATRNQILCSWKFLRDVSILQHILFLILHSLRSMVSGDFVFIEGFVKAVPFLFTPKFYKIR